MKAEWVVTDCPAGFVEGPYDGHDWKIVEVFE
jgi:hypothetical protein